MSASSFDILAAAQRLQAQEQPFALVSVVRVQPPTSARPGDKALVTADGRIEGWVGGGCAQPAVIRTVRQALADGRARLVRIAPAEQGSDKLLDDVLEFGMACHSGGTIELFVDPVLPRARLVVVGDSPVAVALAGLAPRVGLQVTVAAQGADAQRFPDAQQVLATDQPEALCAQVAPGAFVVVATQGRRDVQGLRAALALQARQVSLVASARKAAVLRASLKAAGEDAAAVDAIVAPAGHDIGAHTPEEIALSVLAALVAARRAGGGVPVAQRAAKATAEATADETADETAVAAVERSAEALAAAQTMPKRTLASLFSRIPLPELPPTKGGCCG